MIDFDKTINDANYIKIAARVTAKYRKLLSVEELEQCKYIGIWNACKNYNGKDSIFTTFIYNNIKWECLKQINFNKKFVHKSIEDISLNKSSLMDKLFLILDRDDYSLIHDKFISNKTIKEIAIERQLTTDKISSRLRKILQLVKEVLT